VCIVNLKLNSSKAVYLHRFKNVLFPKEIRVFGPDGNRLLPLLYMKFTINLNLQSITGRRKQLMKYRVDHIPISSSKRPGIKINPSYITIHSTGNEKSTAQNERDWLTNPVNDRSASWHIAVDDTEAIEAIPLDEMAYHAGDRVGNRESISIEIIESGDREETLANAAKLTAMLLYERDWGIDRLRRHYDWSGKICPRILSYDNWKGWDIFLKDVNEELKELKKEGELIVNRYDYIDDIPEYGKETIKNLVSMGYLKGDEEGKLNLSEDMLRIFVVNNRAGLYKKE